MTKENRPVQGSESAGDKPARREETLGESIRYFCVLLLAVFAVRSLVVEPFNIPSGSMIPTLQIGDFVLVSKFSYGYSRFSFPFSPNVFSGRILGSEPHRGDVAVFRFTRDTSVDYIKRIIGLPGDHIQVTGGKLILNGIEVPARRSVTTKCWTRTTVSLVATAIAKAFREVRVVPCRA